MGAFSTTESKTMTPSTHAGRHAFSALDVEGELVDRSIGDFIRQARGLTDEQIARISAYQQEHGIRFGEAAIALRPASGDDVLWALSQQFHYPYPSAESTEFDPELIVAKEPFGEQAEVFRGLHNQLLGGVMASDQPRTALAVLSADRGDGKTYFAANMAIALSQLGGRTLLIDADMRTPRQHVLFRTPRTAGLSGVLAGRSEVEVIQPVKDLPSLYVLPVGVLPPNPTELVQRVAFALLLQEILGKFDHVIVDTPAASHGADARAIAAKCGAALVLGRRNVSSVKVMLPLLRSLSRSQTKLTGVLINEY